MSFPSMAWSRRQWQRIREAGRRRVNVQEVGKFCPRIGIVGDHVVVGAGNRIGSSVCVAVLNANMRPEVGDRDHH